jgi:hypothetical protein
MLAYLLLGLGSDGTEPFDRKLGSAPRCLRVSVAISTAGAAPPQTDPQAGAVAR